MKVRFITVETSKPLTHDQCVSLSKSYRVQLTFQSTYDKNGTIMYSYLVECFEETLNGNISTILYFFDYYEKNDD